MSGVGKSGGKGGKQVSVSKSVSKSNKAGLIFPVGRTAKLMKEAHLAERISVGAIIYCAAIMEYLISEVLDLSANVAKEFKKTRINPRHLTLAIKNDEELNRLLANVTIASGGFLSGGGISSSMKDDHANEE